VAVDLPSYPGTGGTVLFLAIVLVVSIVAGSLPMVAVSSLLLAVFGGLKYRARTLERELDRPGD
jgi:hypothetical protein